MGVKLNQGANHRQSRLRHHGFSEINVTPMVDVMLVLLIIFMVAAPMLTSGVPVDLPESKAPPLKGNDEPLTVSIQPDGSVYLQEDEIAPDELAAKLSAVATEGKNTRIFVRGDHAIDYGKVMLIVGEINAAGFTKVSLITETGNRK